MNRIDDLERIQLALQAAARAVRPFTSGDVAVEIKAGRGDPVTAADRAADAVLREILLQRGEGWLSEESADDRVRLSCRRVWVVDPIDGTREFVAGIPEWCISIGLVESGVPVAGGIFNPATRELILGSLDTGVTYNGKRAEARDRGTLDGAEVLASRSEVERGEWRGFEGRSFTIKPCGSVAYKMARVAAGKSDATWTLVPKSEWDVAGGTALVRAAGGRVTMANGSEPPFNQPEPDLPNLVAAGPGTADAILGLWGASSGR
jgi:myo-inositol-1(or 4)-monophosphatase